MNFQKTWATQHRGFFKGDLDRPISKLEKAVVYVLEIITVLMVLHLLAEYVVYYY